MEAEGSFREALNVYRQAGDRSGEAASLLSLGNTARGYGHYEEAEERFREALAIFRQTGGSPR